MVIRFLFCTTFHACTTDPPSVSYPDMFCMHAVPFRLPPGLAPCMHVAPFRPSFESVPYMCT